MCDAQIWIIQNKPLKAHSSFLCWWKWACPPVLGFTFMLLKIRRGPQCFLEQELSIICPPHLIAWTACFWHVKIVFNIQPSMWLRHLQSIPAEFVWNHHTYRTFRDSSLPQMYVFGLWKETSRALHRTWTWMGEIPTLMRQKVPTTTPLCGPPTAKTHKKTKTCQELSWINFISVTQVQLQTDSWKKC